MDIERQPAQPADHGVWLTTTPGGTLLEVSTSAAKLLNMSARHLAGREFFTFVGSDRTGLTRAIARMTMQFPAEFSLTLQPRDRRRVAATVVVTYVDAETLRWTITAARALVGSRRRDLEGD